MRQDKGPKTNLGFGIPLQSPNEDSGPPSNASFIQKSLADKPVLSFLATGAASIVAMHLAGRVVRQGGLRFGYKLGEVAKSGSELAPMAQTAVNSIRQLRTYLDELEGVSRNVDSKDLDKLVKRETVVKAGRSRFKYSPEETHQVDNFLIRAGRIQDGDQGEAWTVADSIQQRLVSQARRLPYELPAFYLADKAVITPLFNKDSSKKPVNWHNPVDVIGDFAYSSVKNLAFNVLPFEFGTGLAGGTYNKYMSQATSFFSGQGGNTTQGLGVLTMRSIMAQVGADAGEALNAVSRYSNQTAGAMSTFVRHSMDDGVSFGQWVRHVSSAANQNPAIGNSNFARRTFNFGKAAVAADSRSMLLNAMPGPFKGIGEALKQSRKSFKQTGETYDLWQKVVSGKMKFVDLGDKQQDVRDFMLRGGRTRVEEFATQVFEMGRGGPKTGDFKSGTFYQNRVQDSYRRLLASNLTHFGLDEGIAAKFATSASLVKPYSVHQFGGELGGALSNRFRFTANEYTGGASEQEWWKWMQSTSKKAKLDLDGLDFGKFRSAIVRADATFSTPIYRKSLEAEVENQWNFIHGRILPRFGSDILTTNKRPYEEFEGTLKSSQRDFLVRRTAQRLGVPTTDKAGNLVPDKMLHDAIRSRGFDPTKLNTMKGFLISKGDIAKPWSLKGANLFGFSHVTVAEAQHNGFFEANKTEVKNEIAHIVNNRQFGYQLPNTSHALRMKGVYKTASGSVIDLGRITRGLSRSLDTFADEYQTPLVHFSPLNLMGYGANRDLRRKAVIQYESGSSLQPFLAHGGPNADFHLWMKTSAHGSKGKVVSITGGKGAITPQAYEFAGSYKAFATDPYGLLGRHVRIASKELGMQDSSHRSSKWRRKADLSYDQSESLFSLAKRAKQYFTRDPEARTNPRRAAEYFARGADPNTFGAAETTGFANLKKHLRGFGFSKRLVAHLSGDPEFSQIFKRTINGKLMAISDVSDPQLAEVVRQVLQDDVVAATTDVQKASTIRNQSVLRNLIKKGMDNSDYFDRPTPQALRSIGVSRKIDELRNEFYKYSALQAEVSKGPQGFNSYIQDLLAKVESLASSGKIAKGEKSEARAAILGMQLEFFTNKAYRNIVEDMTGPLGAVPRDIASGAVGLLRGEGVDAQKLLSEFASTGPSTVGRLGFIKNLARRRMGATPYDMGDQWNPFGGRTAFVPTFGTAFKRNPRGAVSSVLGGNTWSDTQSFSGASTVSSHMVYRLNRYFETFHMGIDPTKYKGPLDFYARGMVGKRVLPIVAGATTAAMIDRQMGGLVHKDAQGNPIYSPLIMGAAADVIAQGQIALAAAIPGGQTGKEKKYELKEGEVPIRSGRFWPLGNCVIPTQLIQTGYGEFKEAQSVVINDLVITHEGILQPVLDVITREMRHDEWTPEIKLHTIPFTNITTDNHPYLAIKKKRCPSSSYVDCRPDRNGASCKSHQYKACRIQDQWEPQWIEAQYLEEGDYLAYPRIKFDTKRYDIDGIPADFDLGYIVGIYLAEGNIHSYTSGKPRGLEFSLNVSEINIIETLDLFFDKYFNIRGQVITHSENGIKVRYLSTRAAEFIHNLLYDGREKKFIRDIYLYTEEFAKGVLSGYFDGDGHFSLQRNSLSISCTSERLEYLLQVRNLLFTFGIENSIHSHDSIQADIGNTGDLKDYSGWRIHCSGDAAKRLNDLLLLYKTKDLNLYFEDIVSKYIVFDDDYAFIKIESITDNGYRGVVYDYEIQESHSFCSVISVMHNTPFKGGRIQYFRPSWYQRFKSGASFIPEKKETPLERLAFGYDFSPLRPLDPYRFERENYSSRPYPVSGDYFTGPWGPLTSALNQTVGRVLKPRKTMHKDELKYGLQQYAPVGESGAYLSTSPITGVPARYSRLAVTDKTNQIAGSYVSSGFGSGTPFYGNMGVSAGRGAGSIAVRENASFIASQYSQAAGRPGDYSTVWNSLVPYGVPSAPGQMQPRVVASQPPMNPGSSNFQARKFGYQTQEMLGIYGFGVGSMRASLGMGTQDYTPNQSILEPASRGYSSGRSFWGMNLGGLGDLPLPIEGNFANLEISEIVRRFVPKEQSGINYVNPLPNNLGKQYPWLPGLNYPLNPLKTGDPYGSMPDAEIRLPGTGYNRTHQIFSDQYGSLGLANIHDILADVAPWSQEYRAIDKFADGANLSEMEFAKIKQTRAQVEAMRMKEEFTPYQYKYRDPLEIVDHPTKFAVGKAWEWLSHRDTYFNTKFLPNRTVVEDWERDNVYGATFPTWQNPVQSFLKPMANKASQRNPFLSALAMGTVGSLFGVTPKAKRLGSIVGGTLGFAASSAHSIRQAITGERFIPEDRKKELALEEYSDILSYTRAVKLATQASQSGDEAASSYFVSQAKKTMYGADLNATPEQIAMAIPKRKREHFRSMIYAPVQERAQILSTAGRLERRVYEAAWGMPVEQRPDIPEYFTKHELPGPESELWSPLLNMDTIKIKVGQSQGIDMSQMGYFPQQIKEANLINPSYPQMFKSSSQESIDAQLRRLIYNSQISGSVRAIPTPFGGSQVQLNVGVV